MSANEPILPQGAGYGVGMYQHHLSLATCSNAFASSRRYVSLHKTAEVSGLRSSATGIGLFFSAFMLSLTAIQARYTGFSPKSSEEFNSASRSVKPGLIASGIVSAWTWAATLVCSSVQIPCCPAFPTLARMSVVDMI